MTLRYKTLLSTLLTVLFAQMSVHAQDAFEPNNNFFEAKEIFINQPIQATIFDVGDADFYIFNSPRDGVLEVSVTAIGTVNIFAGLYDEAQELINSESEGLNEAVNFITLSGAGQYYVEVQQSGSDNRSSTDPYTLTVALDTTDANEVNNSFPEATLINGGTEVRGTIRPRFDRDFYQFEVMEPGEIRILMLDVPPEILMNYVVYNPTQQMVSSFSSSFTGTAIDQVIEVTETGTHYIEIFDRRDNVSSTGVYRLTISGDPVGKAIIGDVGSNGVVDAGDASLVLQAVVGLASLTNPQLAVADVDGNGFIQAADASLILQYVVGLITEFPVEGMGKSNHGNTALAWGEATRSSNGTWSLPLVIDDMATSVYAIEATLDIDPTTGQIDSFEASLPDDWVVATNDDGNGRYRLAMAGTTPLANSEVGDLQVDLISGLEDVTLKGSGRINTENTHPISEAMLSETPVAFSLKQNYPNPFNPNTRIVYTLAQPSFVRLHVINLLGQEVASLVTQYQDVGEYEVIWDATHVSSGTYFYRFEAGAFSETRVLTVLK